MGIYLDNAATSYPKPKKVVETVYDFMVNNGCTSGRGAYEKAMKSDMLVFETRKSIADFFGVGDPKRVIFTSNATESINLVIRGILKKGDHVITSSLEHNSVWRALKTIQNEMELEISTIPCDRNGYTNSEDIIGYIKENTALIVFTHSSNVLGTLQPIAEIGKIAREKSIPFLVDASQSAGSIPIDVCKENIDIFAFTGHKSLFGPMGIGGFIVNCEYDIKPIKSGSTGGDSIDEYQPKYYPNKLEAGTLNVPAIIGLNEGIKFLNEEGVDKIREKEKDLIDYAINSLLSINGITIYGPKNSNDIVGIASFNIKGKNPEEIAYLLDQKYGIMVRTGLHCAPNAHNLIGTIKNGTVRISVGYFNDKSDIDKLCDALREIL